MHNHHNASMGFYTHSQHPHPRSHMHTTYSVYFKLCSQSFYLSVCVSVSLSIHFVCVCVTGSVLGTCFEWRDQCHMEKARKKRNTITYWQRSQSLKDTGWQLMEEDKGREGEPEGGKEGVKRLSQSPAQCVFVMCRRGCRFRVISIDCFFVNSTYCTPLYLLIGKSERADRAGVLCRTRRRMVWRRS